MHALHTKTHNVFYSTKLAGGVLFLNKEDGAEFELPGDVILELMETYVRDEIIEKIEQLPLADLIDRFK